MFGYVPSNLRTRLLFIEPDTPGPINLTGSDLDANNNDIHLAWGIPTGVVSGYTVNIWEYGTDEIIGLYYPKSSHVNVTSSKLKNGQRYKVVITAESQKFGTQSETSDPRTEVIKTVVKAPDPPTYVNCVRNGPGLITLAWFPPTLLNGDILQYIIDVFVYEDRPFSTVKTKTDVNVFTVQNLHSDELYTFDVYTENEKYISIKPGTLSTRHCSSFKKLSDPPSNLSISDVQSRTFTMTWSDPINTYSEENFGYVVQIKNPIACQKEQIYRCEDCVGTIKVSSLKDMCGGFAQTITNIGKNALGGTQTYRPSGLIPDTDYVVIVTAFNSLGRGEQATKTVKTTEESPQTPTDVQIRDINSETCIVTWEIAGPRPGQTNFTIYVTADAGASSFETTVIGFGKRTKVLEDLEEYWNYTILVRASTSVGNKTSSKKKFRTKPSAPGPVEDFRVTTSSSNNLKLLASWKIPILLNRNGIITGYKLRHNVSGTEILKEINGTNYPEGHMYKEEVNVVPGETYAFEIWPVNSLHQDGSVTRRVYETPSEGRQGLTEDKGADASSAGNKVGNTKDITYGVSGALTSLAVSGLIVGFVCFKRKYRNRAVTRCDDKELIVFDKNKRDIPKIKPVALSKFEAELDRMHKDNNYIFSYQFQRLQASTSENNSQEEKYENPLKKRISKIIPIHQSFTTLKREHDIDDTASFFPGYRSPREFIGCKEPTHATEGDFWRIVWEQNASVIVMLTLGKEENQQSKQKYYWPKEMMEQIQIGDIKLEVTAYFSISTAECRTFKLVYDKNTRLVNHFHTRIDFQNSSQHEMFLDFISHVRSNVHPSVLSRPILVHSSAGIEGTGPYIILDHLLQLINENDLSKTINIYDMVSKLRKIRANCVHTEEHFVFIHDCVKIIIDRKNKLNNVYDIPPYSGVEENVYTEIENTAKY